MLAGLLLPSLSDLVLVRSMHCPCCWSETCHPASSSPPRSGVFVCAHDGQGPGNQLGRWSSGTAAGGPRASQRRVRGDRPQWHEPLGLGIHGCDSFSFPWQPSWEASLKWAIALSRSIESWSARRAPSESFSASPTRTRSQAETCITTQKLHLPCDGGALLQRRRHTPVLCHSSEPVRQT